MYLLVHQQLSVNAITYLHHPTRSPSISIVHVTSLFVERLRLQCSAPLFHTFGREKDKDVTSETAQKVNLWSCFEQQLPQK